MCHIYELWYETVRVLFRWCQIIWVNGYVIIYNLNYYLNRQSILKASLIYLVISIKKLYRICLVRNISRNKFNFVFRLKKIDKYK